MPVLGNSVIAAAMALTMEVISTYLPSPPIKNREIHCASCDGHAQKNEIERALRFNFAPIMAGNLALK